MFKILALAVLVPVSASAHDAPLGWAYDSSCCSGRDCHQMAEHGVLETKKGYVIAKTQELISYGDYRVKRSHDEYFHQCVSMYTPEHSYCLYVPDRGF